MFAWPKRGFSGRSFPGRAFPGWDSNTLVAYATVVTSGLGGNAVQLTGKGTLRQDIVLANAYLSNTSIRVSFLSKTVFGQQAIYRIWCDDVGINNPQYSFSEIYGRVDTGNVWTHNSFVFTAPIGTKNIHLVIETPSADQIFQGTDFIVAEVAQSGTVVPGFDSSINIGADGYTLANLVSGLNALTGVSAVLLDSSMGNYLARGIMPGEYEIGSSTTLYYPGSMLWHEMSVFGWIFDEQAARIDLAKAQLNPLTAAGAWLNYWGKDHFGIGRLGGESDTLYARRIVHEILRQTCNNKALEIIANDAYGVTVTVTDALPIAGSLPDPTEAPCHFVVDIVFPSGMTTQEQSDLRASIYATLRQYKAAGTDILDGSTGTTFGESDNMPLTEAFTISITFSPESVPGSGVETFTGTTLYCGGSQYEGLRVGCPGLKVGAHNDPFLEQVYFQVFSGDSGPLISFELIREVTP